MSAKTLPRLCLEVALAASLGAAAAHGDVTLTPVPLPPLGLGDDVMFVVEGSPGDLPFLIFGPNPGPIDLPLVGTIEVGVPNWILGLPAFPESGQIEVPFDINCGFVSAAPQYAQAVSISPTLPITVTGKSAQLVLTVDPLLVDDCDGNGVDDDCQLRMSATDCDGDGLLDVCEDDCDANGVPDECQSFADCNANAIPDSCEPDADGDGIPDACDIADCDGDGFPDEFEPDCNGNGIPDDCESCAEDLWIRWGADDCVGPNGNAGGLEAVQFGGCSNVSAVATTLSSPSGHSCVDDARSHNRFGAGFRLDGLSGSEFDLGDDDALSFAVTVAETGGVPAQLDALLFLQRTAPGSTQAGAAPKYGLQVMRDGVEVFRETGRETTSTWQQAAFDFSEDPAFLVFSEVAIFEFYLLAYDDEGAFLAGQEAWELDEFEVDVCCGTGGPAPDCNTDGIPDFCEPDCDGDRLPDDCEDDENGNGSPDDCEQPCGECQGKVDSLELFYGGSSVLDLMVLDNDDVVVFAGIVTPGEVISFAAIGDDFGSNITLVDAGVEILTIHTSCSDPIGAGSLFGDFEVLGGSSDDGGPLCVIIPCGECYGKVDALDLLYTGSTPLDLEVQDNDDEIVFAGLVTPGEVVSFTSIGNDLGSNIHLFDAGDEILSIHTSCSDPIGISSVFGDFVVVGGSSEDGGAFCDLSLDACGDNGKPESLEVVYTGRSCFATRTQQDFDKWSCSGDPDDEPFVHIIAYKDGSNVYFDGFVSIGEAFLIDSANAGQNELSSNTNVDVFALDGTPLQQVNFHTSCSQPLFVGDVYGSIEITGFTNE